jgi:hypothetical protein
MSYFGAPGISGRVTKPVSASTQQKHNNGTLVYHSPLFNFLYHHRNGSRIIIPISKDKNNYHASDELVWAFRENPEQDPSQFDNKVPRLTKQNAMEVYVKSVTDSGKKRNAVVIWYNEAFRTVRFAGSEASATSASSSGQKPIFYIEVFDDATQKNTKRLYGDVVYIPTPPNSPMRFGKKKQMLFLENEDNLIGTGVNSLDFGKKKKVINLKQLRADLKKLL